MKACQMQARPRHQRGQAPHEFQWRHPDVRGAVAPRALQLQHNVARAIALNPLFGDRRACNKRHRRSRSLREWALQRTSACRLKPSMKAKQRVVIRADVLG